MRFEGGYNFLHVANEHILWAIHNVSITSSPPVNRRRPVFPFKDASAERIYQMNK